MSDDPFSDYQTTAAPTDNSGVTTSLVETPIANVKPKSKITARVASDPFDVYPTVAASASEPVGTTPSTSAMSDPGGGLSFINSFPIVGPALIKAGAGVDALTGASPNYSSALANSQKLIQSFNTNHPVAAPIANAAGSIVGTAPAIAAAPEIFGVGAGSLMGRSALSALSGAGIGGTDAAVRGQDIGRGAVFGGLTGTVAPGVGELAGRALSSVGSALSGTSPGMSTLAARMHAAGLTPMQVQAELANLGANGTIADTDPALQKLAGGLASTGDAPTSILARAMRDRAQGADQRMNDVVSQTLGPRPDLTATEEGIRTAASAAAAPHYNAARANPIPMDATPVVSYIDTQLQNAKGGVAKTLQMARNLVTKDSGLPGVSAPETDPQGLLSARQALDDFIQRAGDSDTTAGRNALREANNVRSQIDQIVKSDPNIAQGDQEFVSRISGIDAMKTGNSIFQNGTKLEDFQRSVAGATPTQLDAMRKGALAAIHDKIGGQTGDYAAVRNLLAKGTLNRDKLNALFPNSQQLFDNLNSEITMRGTEHAVAGNSETAARLAIAKSLGVPTATSAAEIAPTMIGEAFGGRAGALAANLGAKGFRSALSGLREASNLKMRTQLAHALSASGNDLSPVVDQMTKAFMGSPRLSTLSSGASALTNATARGIPAAIPSSIHVPGVSVLSSLLGSQQQ